MLLHSSPLNVRNANWANMMEREQQALRTLSSNAVRDGYTNIDSIRLCLPKVIDLLSSFEDNSEPFEYLRTDPEFAELPGVKPVKSRTVSLELFLKKYSFQLAGKKRVSPIKPQYIHALNQVHSAGPVDDLYAAPDHFRTLVKDAIGGGTDYLIESLFDSRDNQIVLPKNDDDVPVLDHEGRVLIVPESITSKYVVELWNYNMTILVAVLLPPSFAKDLFPFVNYVNSTILTREMLHALHKYCGQVECTRCDHDTQTYNNNHQPPTNIYPHNPLGKGKAKETAPAGKSRSKVGNPSGPNGENLWLVNKRKDDLDNKAVRRAVNKGTDPLAVVARLNQVAELIDGYVAPNQSKGKF